MSDYMIPITKTHLYRDIDEAVKEYLGEDLHHVYYFPNRSFIPFCYFEDFLYLHLVALDLDYLKTAKIKEMIYQFRGKIQKHLQEKQFDELFSLTDKVIKIDMYIKYFDEIPDHDKYDLFQMVYVSSNYNFNVLDRGFLQEVFSYRPLSKKWKKRMNRLKEKVGNDGFLTIYRGEGSKSTPVKKAYSWTLDLNVAQFFATRFDEEGLVWKAKVHVNDVIDYITHLQEEEVLVDPYNLKEVILEQTCRQDNR